MNSEKKQYIKKELNKITKSALLESVLLLVFCMIVLNGLSFLPNLERNITIVNVCFWLIIQSIIHGYFIKVIYSEIKEAVIEVDGKFKIDPSKNSTFLQGMKVFLLPLFITPSLFALLSPLSLLWRLSINPTEFILILLTSLLLLYPLFLSFLLVTAGLYMKHYKRESSKVKTS